MRIIMLLNLTMQPIEFIEKHLPDKRKALLQSLRKHNWHVVGIDEANAVWALESKWLIESMREEKGFKLLLWFYKYDGNCDGMDRVVATTLVTSEPSPYSGQPSIEFDLKHFDNQLQSFMSSLNMLRFESRAQGERLPDH